MLNKIFMQYPEGVIVRLKRECPSVPNLAFCEEMFDDYDIVSCMVKTSTIFPEACVSNPITLSMAMSLGFFF